MGKAERIRRMNAREKIAAQQAAARRMEARRRMFLAGGSVLVVLVVVIVLIIAKAASNTPAVASGKTASSATTASVTKDISTVPASTLNAVGKGSGVSPLIPTKAGQPMLTSGGKPEILYVGAEYCPYCGAERWAMAVALSRFGTFSGLHLIHSSNDDVFTNTATLSFYKSTYTSKYIAFDPVEWYSEKPLGDGYATLQKPTAAQSALFTKYDAPPYISSADAGSFPFVDFGNQYLVLGAQYLPSTLGTTATVDPGHYGLSWTQIASDLKDPSSPVAQGIDGAANSITAAICKITNNADAAVCSSAAATAGAGSL
jgi:hypothetical protein